MKPENNFIKELEKKAREQRGLVETQMIPDWARGVASWLATNPWRVIVPISCMLYLMFRVVMGVKFAEIILQIFGGYGN